MFRLGSAVVDLGIITLRVSVSGFVAVLSPFVLDFAMRVHLLAKLDFVIWPLVCLADWGEIAGALFVFTNIKPGCSILTLSN